MNAPINLTKKTATLKLFAMSLFLGMILTNVSLAERTFETSSLGHKLKVFIFVAMEKPILLDIECG